MSDRITDLEVKVSFLEANLLEYDQLIQELFKKTKSLEDEITRLEEQQKTQVEGHSLQDEKPPHY